MAPLASLARTHFGAGEENRAKDAKDAKVKGMKDNEIGRVVVGVRLPLTRNWVIKGQIGGRLSNLGELGVLGANPFRGWGWDGDGGGCWGQ